MTVDMGEAELMSTEDRECTSISNYTPWLQQWQKQFSLSVHIPLEACKIVTPLQAAMWNHYLIRHPNQDLITFFISGITQGFRIGFDYSLVSLKSARNNLESAQSHPSVVDDYLKTEVELSCVAGPFPPNAVHHGQVSRFGVIPKKSTSLINGA